MAIDSPALVWDALNPGSVGTLNLQSPDFDHNGPLPRIHAAKRAGGQNLSPALTWTSVPDAAQLLLIVEDPDAPTRKPYLHCLALLDGTLPGLDRGALNIPVGPGVQLAESPVGEGYFGPAPPRTHGPHRYIFQLFALGVPLVIRSGSDARSAAVRNAEVIARGRLDGTYQRD